jgi:hypothetical protein
MTRKEPGWECLRFRKAYPEGDFRHLDLCEECQRWVEDQKRIESWFSRPPFPIPDPEPSLSRLLPRLPAQPRSSFPEPFPYTLYATGLMVVLALLLGLWRSSGGVSPTPAERVEIVKSLELFENLEEIAILSEEES